MSSKVFLRLFIIFFVGSAIFVSIWGWTVVQNVRVTAERTDTQIRTLAWASLSYAATHGVFPMTKEDIEAFGVGPESIAIAPGKEDGWWPTTRAEALRQQPPAEIPLSMQTILVAFGTGPAMPPYFKPDGLPTKIGTIEEINRWLESFGKRGKPAEGSADAAAPAPAAVP